MIENDANQESCFIDSNIWLYSFIEVQDQRKSNIAKSIVQLQDIAVSTQVINEVCVNLIKKANFNENNIRKLIHSFHEKYNVIEIGKEALLRASEIRERHHFSFWDSIIFACALFSGSKILFSEDMHDSFILENIRIVNPFNQAEGF